MIDENVLKKGIRKHDSHLLLFITPNCKYCEKIISEIANIKSNDVTIISDKPLLNTDYLKMIDNTDIEFSISNKMFEFIEIKYVPYVILLNTENQILKEQTVKNYSEITTFLSPWN